MSISFLIFVAVVSIITAVFINQQQRRFDLIDASHDLQKEQLRRSAVRSLYLSTIFIVFGVFRAGTLLRRGAFNQDVMLEFGLIALVLSFGLYQSFVFKQTIQTLINRKS